MNIAIRVDASPHIGSGHFMRCLCLADALATTRARVLFLCRALPMHMAEMLRQHGHALAQLPPWEYPDGQVEQPWPAAARARDLQDCRTALAGRPALQWLVIDHYRADRAWEIEARGLADRLMAIDDLVREHDCDMLLDSNVYPAGTTEYASRVPAACRILIGPANALLRTEFLHAHDRSRVRDGPVRRLLVFLGGMDTQNFTSLALSAIALLPAAQRPAEVDVIIGPTHPWREVVERACASLGATLHVGTRDMALLCEQADLAIGAGGSATWERCAVGLPTIALEVAANQARILQYGARAGLLYAPDAPVLSSADMLCMHLRALIDNSALRHHISRRGLDTVDARGAQRVTEALTT